MAQAVTTNNSLSVDQLHAAATGWRYARKQVTVLVQRPSQKIQIVINYAIVVSLIYPGVGVVSCCRLMSKGCHKICILSHLCWAQPTSRCFFSAWTGFVFFSERRSLVFLQSQHILGNHPVDTGQGLTVI